MAQQQTLNPASFGPLTNQLWQAGYASLGWLSSIVNASGASRQPASLASNAELVLQGLLNGVQAIDAQAVQAVITQELPMLRAVAALPLPYTSSQSATLNGRIASLSSLLGVLQPLVLPSSILPTPAISALNFGLPAIQDIGLLPIYATWNAEPPPASFNQADLPTFASGYAADWFNIATGVAQYYGSQPQPALDSAVRAAQGAILLSDMLLDLFTNSGGIPSTLPDAQDWNMAVALPATLTSVALLRPDISLAVSQTSMATRAFFLLMAEQLSSFILGVRGLASTIAAARATSVISQQGQGLMDIAAQGLGNFESWSTLTSGISAPWAAGGIQTGTPVSLSPGVSGLTQAAILGTDIDLGPQGQPIAGWAGDIPVILGVGNYRASLARRLSTSLGQLIYHQDYGSRIPPELGQVLTTGAQALITAYGKSALAADPRTQAILSASTTMLSGQPNSVFFSAVVQPIGPGLAPIQLNEVLTPA